MSGGAADRLFRIARDNNFEPDTFEAMLEARAGRCEGSRVTLPAESTQAVCPKCGKAVKLLAKYPAHGFGEHKQPARDFRIVPTHNKP